MCKQSSLGGMGNSRGLVGEQGSPLVESLVKKSLSLPWAEG